MKNSKEKKQRKFPFAIVVLALLGGLFLGSVSLISGDSWIDGGAYIYPNSSWSDNVNIINGTLEVMGVPVCLFDGSNCPNLTGNGSQGPAGNNGTDGVGIKNIYVLPNGSIQVNLTNGTNTTSGNLTGPKGDTGNTGSQGPQGDPGPTGPIGANGTNGVNGINGTNGLNGSFINDSDASINRLNVTELYENFNGEETNYSLSVVGAIISFTDTDGFETYAQSTGFWTNGELRGTSLDIDQLLQASSGSVVAFDLAIEPLSGSGGIFRIKDDFGVDIMNISGYTGGLYLNGYANITGQVYSNGVTVCQSDGTNCPSSSGDGTGGWTNTSTTTTTTLNVGIGTTSPRAKLDVNGSVAVPYGNITLGNSTASAPYLKFIKGNSLQGGAYFMLEDGTTVRGYVYMDNLEDLQLKGDDVYITAGSKTNAVTVKETTGYVGIGTTGPTVDLEVNGSALVRGVLTAYSGEADAVAVAVGGPLTTYAALQFVSEQNRTRDFIFSSVNNSVQSARMAFRVSGNEAGGNSGGDLSILRFDDSGTFIDTPFKIDRSDGYIGIGDSTPDAKLDVVGNTILEGDVNISGDIHLQGYHLQPTWTNWTNVDQDVLGTTLANITNLGWTALANKNYTFDCQVFYRSNLTTNGISFALEDWGSTVNRFRMSVEIDGVSATTENSRTVNVTATKVSSTAVAVVNTVYGASLNGLVINGASDVTITPQFSAEIAGSNSTIVRDSYCKVSVV